MAWDLTGLDTLPTAGPINHPSLSMLQALCESVMNCIRYSLLYNLHNTCFSQRNDP